MKIKSNTKKSNILIDTQITFGGEIIANGYSPKKDVNLLSILDSFKKQQ